MQAEKQASNAIEDHPVIRHQVALIDQLAEMNKLLHPRLYAMEAKLCNMQQHDVESSQTQGEAAVSEPPAKRRRTSAVTHLKDTWFTWYVGEPRLWLSTDPGLTKKKSDAKLLVAFMKLFLDDGFMLDERSARYRDDMVAVGERADRSVHSFLRERGIKSRGSNAVLKHMRNLQSAGVLDVLITRYRRALATGKMSDPAPRHTQDIIQLSTTTAS